MKKKGILKGSQKVKKMKKLGKLGVVLASATILSGVIAPVGVNLVNNNSSVVYAQENPAETVVYRIYYWIDDVEENGGIPSDTPIAPYKEGVISKGETIVEKAPQIDGYVLSKWSSAEIVLTYDRFTGDNVWHDKDWVPSDGFFYKKVENPTQTPPPATGGDTNQTGMIEMPKDPSQAPETHEVSATPVYRLYNPALKVHLYTKDTNEYKLLGARGWTQEGVAFTSASEGTPIYRLYNPALKVHLYTKDTNEYKVLGTRGWTQEGVAFTSASEGVPVYRLYNPALKVHLYTKDTNEYKILGTRGWTQEGVAFYTAN